MLRTGHGEALARVGLGAVVTRAVAGRLVLGEFEGQQFARRAGLQAPQEQSPLHPSRDGRGSQGIRKTEKACRFARQASERALLLSIRRYGDTDTVL